MSEKAVGVSKCEHADADWRAVIGSVRSGVVPATHPRIKSINNDVAPVLPFTASLNVSDWERTNELSVSE